MSKKKVEAERKPRVLRDDATDGVALLVSVGFTPAQVQAMSDVADGVAPPEAMVQVGFWPYVAEQFVNFNDLTADDLTRAGFSTAQVEVLTA